MKKFVQLCIVTLLVCFTACLFVACGEQATGSTGSKEAKAELSLDLEEAVRVAENLESISFSAEKRTIGATVKNAYNTFDLNSIQIGDGEKITFYRDKTKIEVLSGSVELSVGENSFYVVVKKGNTSVAYTMTIVRRENDGTIDEPEPHTEHSFGQWRTVTQPTCTEKGVRERTCACGEKEREDVEPLGHAYENGVCSRCGQPDYSVGTVGLRYSLQENDTYEVFGYEGNDKVVVIPETYQGKAVTSIGSASFIDGAPFEQIWLPDSIIEIKEIAFITCVNLKSVTIPSSVTKIGKCAFLACFAMTEINVAEENQAYSSRDGVLFNKDQTTLVCYPLAKNGTSYTIPSGVKTVDMDNAFLFSEQHPCPLRNVYISEDNEHLCSVNGVLFNKDKTTLIYYPAGRQDVKYRVPESVTTIGKSAFDPSAYLKEVTFGAPVTRIEEYAFENCVALTDFVYPGTMAQWDAVEKGEAWDNLIGDYTVHCTDGNIGETAEEPDYTAGLQYTLKEDDTYEVVGYEGKSETLVIPATYLGKPVTSIADQVLDEDQSNLKTVYLSEEMTDIGDAFIWCLVLENIFVSEENAVYSSRDGLLYDKAGTTLLCYPSGRSEYSYRIPEGTTVIGAQSFLYSAHLVDVEIPDSVTTIKSGAFTTCFSILHLTIGGGVTTVEDYAFDGCMKLVEIYNKSALTIEAGSEENGGVGAVARNIYTEEGGSRISIEDGYVLYKENDDVILMAYVGTETDLVIPDSITEINAYALYDIYYGLGHESTSHITSVVIGDNVKTIGEGAFATSAVTSVKIGNGVETIGGYAFNNCFKLLYVEVGSRVTEIGEAAFEECTRLVEVYNKSSLHFVIGSTDHGSIAKYAKVIYTDEQPGRVYMDEDGYILYVDGEDVVLVGYEGTEKDLFLPERVTEIAAYAMSDFYRYNDITSVVMGDKVTKIGDSAFGNCYALTRVEMGANVREIGKEAFKNSRELKSVILSDKLVTIGERAFYACVSLEEISLPAGVTSIGESAFYECAALKNVTIPSGVTEIPRMAFENCRSLGSVTIPVGVTVIRDYAFSQVPMLKDIFFVGTKQQWENIQKESYWDRSWDEELDYVVHCTDGDIIFGEEGQEGKLLFQLKDDGTYEVVGFTGAIVDLVIPSEYVGIEVTSIGSFAFSECTSIMSINFPESVTSIGEGAFFGCTGVSSLTIGDYVTDIEFGAFFGCTALDSVFYTGDLASWCSKSGMGAIVDHPYDLFIDGEEIPNELVISDVGTDIREYAFTFTRLTSVTIDDDVTNIGYGAFCECASLVEAEIGIGVTTLAGSLFENCSELTDVTLGNRVTDISSSVFSFCSSLESITYAGTMEQWNEISKATDWDYRTGDYVVYCSDGNLSKEGEDVPQGTLSYKLKEDDTYEVVGHTGVITDLVIPSEYEGKAVTSIAERAFEDCSDIVSLSVPGTVLTIGEYAFFNSSSLSSVTLGEGVKVIGLNAFCDANGISSLYIPASIEEIGGDSLRCNDLFEINVAEENAFYCSEDGVLFNKDKTELVTFPPAKVISVYNVPESVTTIGYEAFLFSTGVEKIVFGDNVTSVGNAAFYGCSGLSELIVGNGLVRVGAYQFAELQDVRYNIYENGLYFGNETNPYVVLAGIADDNISTLTMHPETRIMTAILWGNETLVDVIVPDSVVSIGSDIFGRCPNLQTMHIGHGLRVIEENAIYSCENLTDIYYNGTVEEWRSIEKVSWDEEYCTYTIHCLDEDLPGHVHDYVLQSEREPTCITEGYRYYRCECGRASLREGIESLGHNYVDGICTRCGAESVETEGLVFSLKEDDTYEVTGYTGVITDWVIPSEYEGKAVTSIASKAFEECGTLRGIQIGDNVKEIGEGAFYDCRSLVNVSFPSGLIRIGDGAFMDCTTLSSLFIPETTIDIGFGVFGGCESIVSLTVDSNNPKYHSAGNCIIDTEGKKVIAGFSNSVIPDDESVTAIGEYAFCRNRSIVGINIPETVTSIGEWAFAECIALKDITLGEEIESIGENAFEACFALTSITIPTGVSVVSIGAFNNCRSLVNVTISHGVTSIGNDAFSVCGALESVEIPNSVTNIGRGAFSDCLSLTDIYFAGTMEQWNEISKVNDWDFRTGDYVVHCSDGDVAK